MIIRKHNPINYITAFAIILSLVFYWLTGYHTDRTEFLSVFVNYSFIFAAYLLLIINLDRLNFRILLWTGIAFRLILIFSVPSLSNDYFRFIWDGNMLSEGLNPYNYLPADMIKISPFANSSFYRELYDGMGTLSQNNYTNYPPLNQAIFLIPSLFTKNITLYIVFYRLVLIVSSASTVIFGRKILERLGINKNNIFIYFLNPLIIIELTGNLHFEGLMIFLFVYAFYLLQKAKYLPSAVVFAFSVLIKLIPLIFIPFIINRIGVKKGIIFSIVTAMIVLTAYLPFYNPEFIEHYRSSLDLYFRKFEFNASIYYIVREVGYSVKGYNIIQSAGPILSAISAILIVLFAVFQKRDNAKYFYISVLFGLTVYYLFATTVHPWYLSVLLILSVFTHYRYVLVWTYFVILSYYTYSNPDFKEYMSFNIIEYGAVLVFFIFEIINTFIAKRAFRRAQY